MASSKTVETLQWIGESFGRLSLIDQTKLPNEIELINCCDVETVWEAIKMLRVRGRPRLELLLPTVWWSACKRSTMKTSTGFLIVLTEVSDYLATSRPTAVNLFWRSIG